MNVLLSIKPKYVDKIISGTKMFEFRRSIFKKQVENVYIYESAPHQRIIGLFPFQGFIYDTIDNLWLKCSTKGGVSKEEFYSYFHDLDFGYAIIINDLKILDAPINPFEKISQFTPPQSFQYLHHNYID